MAIQYAGGTNVNATFTATLKSDIMSNLKTQLVTAGMSNANLLSGQGPGNVGIITVTIASPGVVTFTSHGFLGGERIMFRTTGALPTGITAGTVYFVKFVDANTFNIAATLGGSNINTSGSQSGVHTLNSESIILQTATTPQSYNLLIRIKDNGGTCVQISIETVNGALVGTNSTTAGASIAPGTGKTFRVVANKYQFACFVVGDYNIGREFVLCTCPYVFSFLSPTYIGLMVSNCINDTDTTGTRQIGNWRYQIPISSGTNSWNSCIMIYGGVLWETSNASNGPTGNINGAPCFVFPQVQGTAALLNLPRRYANLDDFTLDTLVIWGSTGANDEPLVRCQLWDSILIIDQFLGDITTAFDAHSWICLTSSVTSGVHGALFLVIP